MSPAWTGDGRSPTVVLATAIEVVACLLSTWANVVAAENNLPGMVMAGVPSPLLFACIELIKADLRRTRRHRLAVAYDESVTATPEAAAVEDMSADIPAGQRGGQRAWPQSLAIGPDRLR